MSRADNIKKTNMERYGVENVSQLSATQDKRRASYKSRYESIRPECPEELVDEFISKLMKRGYTAFQDIQLNGQTYDICCIELATVFELDHTARDQHMYPTYHIEKTENASGQSVRCIHIFDWDNADHIIDCLTPPHKLEVVDSTNLIYRTMPVEDAMKFIYKYDIQPPTSKSVTFAVCAQDDRSNDVYQVAVFGHAVQSRKHSWELLHYCTKPGYVMSSNEVTFTNSLNKSVNNIEDISSLVSYIDASKFPKYAYESIGLHLTRFNQPAKMWYNPTTRRMVTDAKAHQMNKVLLELNSISSEMMDMGYISTYDAGKYVVEL